MIFVKIDVILLNNFEGNVLERGLLWCFCYLEIKLYFEFNFFKNLGIFVGLFCKFVFKVKIMFFLVFLNLVDKVEDLLKFFFNLIFLILCGYFLINLLIFI